MRRVASEPEPEVWVGLPAADDLLPDGGQLWQPARRQVTVLHTSCSLANYTSSGCYRSMLITNSFLSTKKPQALEKLFLYIYKIEVNNLLRLSHYYS